MGFCDDAVVVEKVVLVYSVETGIRVVGLEGLSREMVVPDDCASGGRDGPGARLGSGVMKTVILTVWVGTDMPF